MGQCPFRAVVGKILGRCGAWTCSLIAACIFSAGLFASEISVSPDTITQPSVYTFHHLVIYFFICGVGITFSYVHSRFSASRPLTAVCHIHSYFASVFAASKKLPKLYRFIFSRMVAGQALPSLDSHPHFSPYSHHDIFHLQMAKSTSLISYNSLLYSLDVCAS